MKLSMFKNEQAYAGWLQREIDAIKSNGLAIATERYEKCFTGEEYDNFFKMNKGIKPECRLAAWNEHIRWCLEEVKVYERKIAKYKKELRKMER